MRKNQREKFPIRAWIVKYPKDDFLHANEFHVDSIASSKRGAIELLTYVGMNWRDGTDGTTKYYEWWFLKRRGFSIVPVWIKPDTQKVDNPSNNLKKLPIHAWGWIEGKNPDSWLPVTMHETKCETFYDAKTNIGVEDDESFSTADLEKEGYTVIPVVIVERKIKLKRTPKKTKDEAFNMLFETVSRIEKKDRLEDDEWEKLLAAYDAAKPFYIKAKKQ